MSNKDIKDNGILINAQFGIFFKEMVMKPEVDLWQPISSLFDFDTPIIVPVPIDESLGDVPIVQATQQKNGNNNQLRVTISRKRMDIYIDGFGEQSYLEPLEQLADVVVKIFTKIEDVVEVPRVGLIVRSFYQDEDSNKQLSNLLNKKLIDKHGSRKTVVDTFIRYVTRDKVGSININNYTEYQPFTARIVSEAGTTNPEGILLVRDINTSPDDDNSKNIDSKFVVKYISDVKSHLDFPKFKL